MKARVAIITALPREVAGLVKGVEPEHALRDRGIFLYRLPNVVVVAAGMGAERAAFAVEAALATGGVTDLLSVGLAGSCNPGLPPGSVTEATVVVDVNTGERFECSTKPSGESRELILATTGEIATVAEKRRLAIAYQAVLVDMEAAIVGRLARAHGLPFRAIKGISDAADAELGDLSKFTGKHGSFRNGAFAFYTALRPWTWASAVELGRNSAKALAGLDQSVKLTLALHKTH
jgi:adenosylhomocysteine nucleosidase